MATKIFERFCVASLHHIKALVHAAQVVGIQRLKADQQSLAAAGLDKAQELFVMGGIDAGLADPADLQGDQSSKELLCLIHIGGNVVVDEEDQRLLDPADLLNDLV